METEPIEQTTSPVEWWIAEKKGNVGPFSAEALRSRIGPESWVWRPGWKDWRRAATLREADLAETDENRALFGGLLAEKPPPRRMFLSNTWLWGLLTLPLLSLFAFDFVLTVVVEVLMPSFRWAAMPTIGSFSWLYQGAVIIVCLIMDMAALKDAGYDDKRPFWVISLFSVPLYVAVRAWRTMTGGRLALTLLGAFVGLIVWGGVWVCQFLLFS